MTTEKSSLGNFMFMPIVEQVQCIVFLPFPETCEEAGLSPGCCFEDDCSVGVVCFCDPVCLLHNDCCSDVPNSLDCDGKLFYLVCIQHRHSKQGARGPISLDFWFD